MNIFLLIIKRYNKIIKRKGLTVKILDMHDAVNLETSSTIEADTTQIYNAGTIYAINAHVQSGINIYQSVKSNNLGNDPATNRTMWLAIGTINEKAIYDVYPDTFSTNTAGDIVLTYTATNIDTVFVGNAKGGSVTVNVAGNTTTKSLLDATVSPQQAWGITDDAHGSGDLYVDLGGLVSGVLTVTITLNAGSCYCGYVLFGEGVGVGCTLMSEAIQYNVVSGVTSKGSVLGIDRVKRDSYVEITLPVKLNPMLSMSDTLVNLAKYRGVPMLAIADDVGVRDELIFWGIYTEINASITERNAYSVTMTSLSSKSYVPSTEIEISTEELAEAQANEEDIIYYNYGDSPSILGANLSYIDQNQNGVTIALSDLIDNVAFDATISGGDSITYTDDTDGAIVVLVEDLLNQTSSNITDKSSRHYLRGGAGVPDASDTAKGIVELATSAELIAGTDAEKVITPAILQTLTASSVRLGLVQIATNADTLAGTDLYLAVTPLRLLHYFDNHVATTTQIGTTEIATQAEVDARTDTFRYLTPATFEESEAKTTQKGIIEIATCVETTAGTDTARAVVPACLTTGTYTGTPPLSAFAGGKEVIFDSTTCDKYFVNGGGVVEKCDCSGSSLVALDNGFKFSNKWSRAVSEADTTETFTVLGDGTLSVSMFSTISAGDIGTVTINGTQVLLYNGQLAPQSVSVAVNDGDTVVILREFDVSHTTEII